MRVEVHLHADLARYAPAASRGALTLELASGARVADLIRQLGLPEDRRLIIGVGGESARPEQPLAEGARVDLLPPMAGGA